MAEAGGEGTEGKNDVLTMLGALVAEGIFIG
jgi:hypothetical protein